VERSRLLHIVGIDDSDRIRIRFLSRDPGRVFYDLEGNVDLAPYLDQEEFELFRLVVGGMAGEPVEVPPVRVILNAICDPDTNAKSLDVAEKIVDQLGVPVINHPQVVRRTSRDVVPTLLAGDPEVHVPKTLRVRPMGRAGIEAIVGRGEIVPPFLVREPGTHGGIGLTLVEDVEHLDLVDRFPLDGRDLYLTEFVDFRSPDGLYRKYRVMVIDGLPHPRHMVVAKEWKIHLHSRQEVMPGSPYEDEEKVFLARFCEDRQEVFKRIAARIGAEFFGVDFALDDAGRLVVFEANCCFRGLLPLGVVARVTPPYHQEIHARLRQAFRTLVLSRMG
jgi:glutathione synthase/RimK-type ligase-like ATP-grasp enzyme